jgi:hypothetical protein
MNNRKRTCRLLFLLALALWGHTFSCLAQNENVSAIQRIWHELPDSLFPTLSSEKRLEMIVDYSRNFQVPVNDLMESPCMVSSLADDLMEVSLGNHVKYQIACLLSETDKASVKDSLVFVIRTFEFDDKGESVLWLYSFPQWEKLSASSILPADFPVSPDGIIQQHDDEDPLLVSCSLSHEEGGAWVFTVESAQMFDIKEESENLKNNKNLQRVFKWDGKSFK